jgi:hypothetical protein
VLSLVEEHGLPKAEGVEINSKDDLRKFDRKHKGNKVSNQDWQSSSYSYTRIMKMKKDHIHLSYKQEHTVDLETEAIFFAAFYHGNESDGNTLLDSVNTAQGNLQQADSHAEIKEDVGDKGYHKNETLEKCRTDELRTYICETDSPHRRWTDQSARLRSRIPSQPTSPVKVTVTNAFRSSDQSVWKEVSPTSAKPPEHAAPGCEASNKTQESPVGSRHSQLLSDVEKTAGKWQTKRVRGACRTPAYAVSGTSPPPPSNSSAAQTHSTESTTCNAVRNFSH